MSQHPSILLYAKLTAVSFLLLFFTGICMAQDFKSREWGTGQWSTADTVRQVLYSGLVVTDVAYTRDMLSRPERQPDGKTYYEANPLLGKHPSMASLHRMGFVMIVGNAWLMYQADPENRPKYQWTFIGIESLVIHDYRQSSGDFHPNWPGIKFKPLMLTWQMAW